MSLIELNNLLFFYDDKPGNSAFRLEIEKLSFEKGDFVSILGPNGCGKSTLLKLIARVLPLIYGSIKLDGKEINLIPLRSFAREIAYVPQITYSFFPFSVYEIVMMGRTPFLNLLGFEKEKDKELVKEALSIMEVDHLAYKNIHDLSGGEAQRVFLAKALAQQARIILLDEPNAHLDIKHQIRIFELLRKLNSEQQYTIVSISHDLNLVGLFSDRVVFMKNGKILQSGRKFDLFSEENIRTAFGIDSKIFRSHDMGKMNVIINPV